MTDVRLLGQPRNYPDHLARLEAENARLRLLLRTALAAVRALVGLL